MMMRRYRLGRLVRARRLRRATLESARNLVLQRIGGMLAAMDRFSQMLSVLQMGQAAAAVDADGTPNRETRQGAIASAAEPDTRDRALTCEMQGFDGAGVGGQMLPTGSDNYTQF